MQRTIDIHKVGGGWKVERHDPLNKFPRGQVIEWELHPDPANPKKQVSAHFQFTHDDLVEGNALTPHWTAKINGPGGKLQLKIKNHACSHANPRYYAVWIVDGDLPNGGVFAVGENPPPEIDVGGGP